jgi:hypothetical protein
MCGLAAFALASVSVTPAAYAGVAIVFALDPIAIAIAVFAPFWGLPRKA